MTECPRCGEPAERSQLVCLRCGARIALEQRRPSLSLGLLALLLAVAVLGAGAVGFALSEVTSDPDEEVVAAGAQPPAPSAARGEPQPASRAGTTETAPELTPEAEPAPSTPARPRRGLLLDWPDRLTAHTVVLVTTSDHPAARRVARGAARSGLEAGLLRSDEYDLGSDLWIVFAGRFDSRRGAARQAADLGGRYPGAYPQLIRPLG